MPALAVHSGAGIVVVGGRGEEALGEEIVSIRVSAASARLRFHGCTVPYIESVCKASCCESGGSGIGPPVTAAQAPAIAAHGGVVVNGRLTNTNACGKCYFKTPANLCKLHATPAKPFVCSTGPFHLNTSDTLVVRNRYKLLRCYEDGQDHPDGVAPPAYLAFRGSLDILLGAEEAERLVAHLDDGGGDLYVHVSRETYDLLDESRVRPRIAPGTVGLAGEPLSRGGTA